MSKIVSRIGVTPVGGARYRVNRLRFHLLAFTVARSAKLKGEDAEFLVRCDDTNEANTNRDYLDAYLKTLSEIGVSFDATPYDSDKSGYSMFQSQRSGLYSERVTELLDRGLAYKTEDGAVFFDVPKYTEDYRHLLEDEHLTVSDAAMGSFKVDTRSADRSSGGLLHKPFPIQRADGSFLFNLCSPVDDATMGVTHVIRDRDKLSVLGMQEMIRTALDLPELTYLHAPLLMNDQGTRYISDEKYGDGTYESLVESGFTNQAVISYLLASTEGAPEAFYENIDEFAKSFDIKKVHQAHTRFSDNVLKIHQEQSIKGLTDEQYRELFVQRLALVMPETYEQFENDPKLQELMLQRRGNLVDQSTLNQVRFSSEFEDIESEMLEIAQKVSRLISTEGLDESKDSLMQGYEVCKQELGISKKEYFMSLRIIYTGRSTGIGLGDLLEYLENVNELSERQRIFKQFIERELGEQFGIGKIS